MSTTADPCYDYLAQDMATERIEDELEEKHKEIKDVFDRYLGGRLTTSTYLLETERLCREIKELLIELAEV